MIVVCSLLLAVAAMAVTANRLEFHTDRSDLIDPGLNWQKRYAAYKTTFPHWDDLIVVVDASQDGAEVFADRLANRLRSDALVASVNNGFATAESPPGLLLSQPTEVIETLVADGGAGLTDAQHTEWQHLRTATGRYILLKVDGAAARTDEALLEAVRDHLTAVRSDPAIAHIEAGVTGVPAMEMDESAQSIRDSTFASVAALLLIALLAAVVYRGVTVPILAVVSLLVGVAWSFGYLTIVVGHLQLLSVVFAVILLGLGIDTAIHLIARLELIHPDHDHLGPAVEQVFRGIGPGVLTGTLTTAAAFVATGLTDFRGIAEMGLIAAGGVILCAIAVMSVFPALLQLMPHPERRLRARRGGEARPFMRGKLSILTSHARTTVIVAAIVFAGLGYAATTVRYDPDVLKLQPDGLESVVWERRLLDDDARSFWHAVVIAGNVDQARRLTGSLTALPEVDHVGGAGVLFPEEAQAKRDLLAALPAPLHLLASAPLPTPEDLPASLRDEFVATDGSLLLRAYPTQGEGSMLSPEQLDPFVKAVLDAAPQATGPAVQIYESTRIITRSYLFAAIYAAGAILILLVIDFRSAWDALTAMLPVCLGFVGTFGIMALTDTPLNFANVMVMPLILGLGVDAGVHAVHRWLMQPDDRPRGLAGGTGRAVTLTTITTAIGFACMMTAQHRGIQSLGFVMVIALVLTWCATVFVLPSVLALRPDPRNRPGRRWQVAHPPKSPELS